MKNNLLFAFIFSALTNLTAMTPQRDTILRGENAYKTIAGTTTIRFYANTKIPAFIEFDGSRGISREEAFSIIRKIGNLDEAFDFKLIRTEKDELGFEHERYNQTYEGFPIFGADYILHFKKGNIVSMNGLAYHQTPSTATAITEKAGLDIAKKSMNASLFKWEIPAEEAHIKQEQNDPSATFFPKISKKIMIENGDFFNPNAKLILCYAYDLYAHEPIDRKEILVDASNGNIVFTNQLLQHANDKLGTANTAYSGTQSIYTDSTSPVNYRLRETTRGNGIETYNMQKGTTYSNIDFTDSNNVWNNVNANQDQYATDAHWGCEKTWDYYYYKHGRNSINNAGFKLISYIHYSTNYTNAFWDGSRMTYGDGAAPYTPLVAMDIAGHEVSHGLTSNTSNLVYSNESGALNESFSDIFGVSIDFYSRPTLANWLMGDGIGGTPFRSMANPNLYNDPDTYLGTNWYTGTADNGGVHTNSGVQNYWYYLMVNGGSGTNDLGNAFSVSPLGFDTAGKIAFRNNTVYLTTTSQYADARFYSITAAEDLYGTCSEVVKQTTNAWYAVGVGSKWDTTLTVGFTGSPLTNCLVPSTHSFVSTGTRASFFWDFGNGNTSTLTNPTNVYNTFGSFTVKLVATCGLKKDSLTKVNYITLNVTTPVTFTRTKDTTICEKSTINLYANTNYGPVFWENLLVTDSMRTVTPIATTIYKFSKANGCATYRDSIKVTVIKTPTINSASASFPTICLGSIDTLKATSTLRNDVVLQLGTGTSTTATNGNTPFNRTWEGNRSQWIVLASELTALGAVAGPIKSMQFNVTTTGSGANHQKNFTIKIGKTNQTSMAASFASIVGNLTPVYGPVTVNNPPVGWNTFNFTYPYDWDGVSNIIIDICHDNDVNNTCTNCFSPNAAIQYTTLGYNAVYSNFSDNAQRCGTTGGTTTGYTTTRRPNIRFGFYPVQTGTVSTNWNWTPGNLSTATAVVTPSTIPTSTYKVIATTPASTCKDSANVNINVLALPTLTARTDTTICSGNIVNLTATSSGSVIWNPGGLVGTSVNVNPSTTTQYIASTTNGTCTKYDTVLVTVIPTPTLIARTDTTICFGKTLNLTATSNISPITWNPGSLTGASVLVIPGSSMSFVASVSNACGSKFDTVNVTVIPNPTIVARLDTGICQVQSVYLTATSNITTITWNPGGLIGSSVSVSPSTSTQYIATVNNSCGVKTDTVNIFVTPMPTLIGRMDTVICAGQSVNLTATSNSSPITWNPGGMTGASVPVSPNNSTTYIASVSNACGTKLDTVNIDVLAIPTINARTDSTICAGQSINLTATSNMTTITWNPGGLTGSSVNVSPTNTTSYIASVSNSCATKYDTVVITVIPTPSLTARTDTSICAGQSINLTAASNISPINWNPGGLTGSSVLVTPSGSTTYIASVNNSCGSKIDTVEITIIPIPTLTARTDSNICAGQSIYLSATSNISPISWNPGALTGSNILVIPTNTTAYIASVSNACATKIDTVNIVVTPIPNITARLDSGICNGQSINLTATSNISPITWNPGGLNGTSVSVSPSTTTTYVASVSNACGSAVDTVNISVTPIPNIISRNDSSICSGQSIWLTASSNMSTITWNPGNLNGSAVSVSPTTTTTYIAMVQNACATKYDTTIITVVPTPSIVARPDTTLCKGFPIVLYATANLPITWNPGNITGNYISFFPTTTTNYIGTVQNACGVKNDTVVATVINVPSLTARTDSTICEGNSILLYASSTSSLTWNPGNISGNNISVSPTISTNYYVTSQNACGISKDTVVVNVIVKPVVVAKADFSICIGQPAQLSAISPLSILWNPGSLSGSPVTVNPIATTPYIAQVSNVCGIAKDTVLVTVVNQPTVVATIDTAICPGDNINLQAISNANINWMPGNFNGNIFAINPTSTTQYVATASNLCGTKKDSVWVTVLPIPTVTARMDTSICAGENVILYGNSNLNIINWMPGNINALSTIVTPSNTTAYIASSGNKCGTAIDTVNITVIPLPFVQNIPDTSICKGDSIVLKANGIGSFNWSNGNLTNNIKIAPTTTTTYAVTASNSCGTAVDFAKVNVNEKPTANATYIKNGNSYSFTNNSLFGNKYLWIFGDGKTDSIKNTIHVYKTTGSFTAKLIAINACGRDTFIMKNLTATSDIKDLNTNDRIIIYPNPASELIYIQSDLAEDIKAIAIHNALGENMNISPVRMTNQIEVNIAHLSAGIYQIEIQTENGKAVKSLIINK